MMILSLRLIRHSLQGRPVAFLYRSSCSGAGELTSMLEDALDEYEGSVLLVSHDRAFLREGATRVWSSD